LGALLREGNTCLFGKYSKCFGKIYILPLHNPGEDVSRFSARPAFVAASLGSNRKGRVPVLVKWTETLPIFSAPNEVDLSSDELNDINA
jgi:hypothetical protein